MGNIKSKVEDKKDIDKPTTINKLDEYKVQFDYIEQALKIRKKIIFCQ